MNTFLKLGSMVLVLGMASAASAKNAPTNCYIQTFNGRYVTVVGGGGRISDVIHTDAKLAKAWEKVTLIDLDKGTPNITYGIRTKTGHFLTAVNGGGNIQDVIHSDATQARGWEEFQLESLGGGYFAIKTLRGYFLTAVGAGGRITDVIHSDARRVGNWEKFKFTCGVK